jgi:hypothetical protein
LHQASQGLLAPAHAADLPAIIPGGDGKIIEGTVNPPRELTPLEKKLAELRRGVGVAA